MSTYFLAAMTCENGMVYKRCGSSCDSTCSNPNPVCANSKCVDGCFCVSGYVKEGNRCIRQAECPCTHGTTVFPSGHKLKKDCNNW